MIGGKKIILTVGEKLVRLDSSSALISELSTVTMLLVGNHYGLPLSTSHIKTISCASVGSKVNIKKIKQMLTTWGTVLPACFMASFLLAKWIIF